MGIKGLYKVITDNTNNCIQEKDIKYYQGKVIAIDASLLLYQFVIAIRKNGYDLEDGKGNSTSHLYAIFIKTMKFLEYGIKPVYVFDGKPPELKNIVIKNRKKVRENAKKKLELLSDSETSENSEERIKNFKRTVEIKKEQINECKKLLDILKIPYVDSPGEADAQCAILAKSGKVWGVCTEDMDILTFGSPRILKNLSSSKNKKVIELDLNKIKSSLGISHDQFIDLCILLGCDYCGTLNGVGQKRALQLIKEIGSIDNIISKIKKGGSKYKLPNNFPYNETKNYFKNPNVIDPNNITFNWGKCNKKDVVNFMCTNYGFSTNKINKKLRKYSYFYDKLFNCKLNSK